jgi:putative sigma-54 modulation protein
MLSDSYDSTSSSAPVAGAPKALGHGDGGAGELPAMHLRIIGAAAGEREREYIARKLAVHLAKFAATMKQVTIRVTDVNGPRGGVDLRCVATIELRGLPSVVVERRHARLLTAVDAVLRAAERTVRRTLTRRRGRRLRRPRPTA